MRKPAESPLLEITLFDGPRVRGRGEWVRHFRTQKTAALLSYLALAPYRPHGREFLCELLWPGFPVDAARNSLTTALWSVRQALSQCGVAPADVLIADRGSVQLHPDRILVDALEFEREVSAQSQGSQRIEVLTRAIERYGSGLLPRLDEPWLSGEQARYSGLYCGALDELIRRLEQDARYLEAINYATREAAQDPLDEAIHLRLMKLYQAAGQTKVALQVGDDLLRRLKSEELRPSPRLCKHLSELTESLHTGPTAATPAPVTREREAPGGAVRLDSPFYLARTADEAAEAALHRKERVIRITGPRESGKSSLLSRLAVSARKHEWRVALTALRSFGGVSTGEECCRWLAESLADELRLPLPAWAPERAAALHLRAFLRDHALAGRRLVWVLDDVDQLLWRPYGGAILGTMRSWYEAGAADPHGPWGGLTLLLAYSAEVHLHVADLSHSPFNVGVRVEVRDFTPMELERLEQSYGIACSASDRTLLTRLVGGHPLLNRLALDALTFDRVPVAALVSDALRPGSAFRPHLGSLTRGLKPEVREVLADLANGLRSPDEELFFRLRSGGVLAGESAEEWRFRCELYRRWFRQSPLR